MKKLSLLILGLLTLLPVKADEGMWTLYNLPQAVYDQMKAYGFSLPYENIYSSQDAIKNSAVLFGGFCSGVVVSPDGLVFTNHHCGFEAIRSHSTVEHDYMLNGFYAKDYKDELPNENLFVSFMVEQRDVTARLEALGIHSLSFDGQSALIDSIAEVMTDSVKKIEKTLHVEIDPYYEGNQYFATTYRLFPDVRLVFAVPKSMGKFGGETDNWMWPRQTCDFSVFRIYADPETNGPAEYSERNVPYRPKTWAPVSLQGYKDGDFAMTIGYPGSTERYLSSYGIREMRDAGNATRVQVRGLKQEIMQRHMRADEAVRIKYDSKYAQSANYWKNSMGMNKCIDSIGIIEQKQAYELRLRHWQDTTGYLKGKLDFNLLAKYYGERFERMRAFYYWSETFRGTSELVTRALKAGNGMEVKGFDGKPEKQYIEFEDNRDSWDEALDKEVLAALMKNYREHVSEEYLPSFYKTVDTDFNGDYTAYVNHLYKKSVLMKNGKKLYFNKKKFNQDPGVQLGLSLQEYLAEQREALGKTSDSIDIQERYLCAARLQMEQEAQEFFRKIGISSLIYPEMLAANDINTGLKMSWVRQRWDVHDGALVMMGIKLRESCEILNQPLRTLCGPDDPYHVVAIKRMNDTIIPGGNDSLQLNDMAYFMTTRQYIPYIRQIVGKEHYADVKNVMIMGGGATAVRAVNTMPYYMDAKIIETDEERCEQLNNLLDNDKALVINGDGRDIALLTEEGIRNTQAFVALTGNAETNILACLTAKRLGVRKTVAMVENIDYISMAESLDIGTIINKKAIAASHIYQMMLDANVCNVRFLMAANADVAEFIPKEGSRITQKEVKDLGLPKGMTIGGLVRDGKGMLVSGNTRINAGDSVVVFCHDMNMKKIEKLFI